MDHSDSLNILVIEDEPETAEILASLFKHKFSAETTVAADCESARKRLVDSLFNLITLDYQLPDGTGLELLEEIESMDNPPPVIMVTGHGDEEVASKSFTLGASGYVVKDNRISIMLPKAVDHALSQLALKKAEEEAEKERGKARDYLNIAAVMMLALNADGEITMINRKGCELLGFTEDELMGKDYFNEFVPENVREKARNSFNSVITGSESTSKDFRMLQVGRDGLERNIAWYNTLLKNEEGDTTGLLGSGEDITDRLRNERIMRAQRDLAIRLSETDDFQEIMSIYFQTILDATEFDSGGIYVKDENTGAFDQIFHQGLSEEYAKYYKHIPADSTSAILLQKAVTIHTDYESIKVKHTDAGSREGMKAIAIIPLTYRGDVIGSVNLASHVTTSVSDYSKRVVETLSDQVGQVIARSKLSIALKESEAKYRSLFNNAPGSIAVFDQNGIITDINETACRSLGYTKDEIIGTRADQLPFLPKNERMQISEKHTKRLSGDEIPPYAVEYIKKDGESRYCQVTGTGILDNSGAVIGGMVILADITDRILEEEELKEYERQYKLLFENTKELIIIIDGDSLITTINPAAVESLGYENDTELLGTSIKEYYMNIDDREALLKAILAQGYVKDYELTFRKKDGSPLYTVGSGVLYLDESGKPGKLEAVLTDITRYKEAEQTVRESEELFRRVFREAAVGIALIDPSDNSITEANEAMSRITGYSKDELKGLPIAELFDPDNRAAIFERVDHCIDNRIPVTVNEIRAKKKDGSEIWLEVNGSVIWDDMGHPIYGIGLASDITKQKLAQEKLSFSRNMWERTFEQITSGIFLLSPDFEILQCNRALGELTGKDPDDIIGMKCYELMHGLDSPPDFCVCLQAKKTRKSARGELFEPHFDRYLEIAANPLLDHYGEIEQYVHVVQDVTDRKGAEAELQGYKERLEDLVRERTSELEEVNRRLVEEISWKQRAETDLKRVNTELDGYAHTVSHDLKGPLSSIALSSDLLLEEAATINDEKTREEIEELISSIKKHAKKSFDLAEDLLSLSRAGNVPTELEDVDIKDIVLEILAERKSQIEKKRVKFRVDDYLGSIKANPTQIYELFSNIIGNMVYHNKSEKPEVTVSFMGLDENEVPRYLIRDNGLGVPAGEEETIFEAFHKETGSKGTGIGLATVKKIVELYSGEIRAYNDNGACFEFSLRDFPE
ncbi:MAG: PAS domain S-box protein [Actinobacteria bacterium]|nr:PAS domain S-box protein [Actinomycetota bacterium]